MNNIKFSFLFVLVILLMTSCQFAPMVTDSTKSTTPQLENSLDQTNCLVDSTLERNPATTNQCHDLFKSDSIVRNSTNLSSNKITENELLNFSSQKIMNVDEFKFIRAEAKKMGVRVWMFGGTASSFLHYVKWDLARQKGQLNLQSDRFDYDFTNIFRSTQDLDIVIDGTAEQVQSFQNILSTRFPYLAGSRKAWEVRSLRFQVGNPGHSYFKEALLNDRNFSDQNTDTNSLAMVEISESKDIVVRDLRSWFDPQKQLFLTDAVNDTISYLRNPKHFQTARAKLGENPEILSVLRLLVKAFQYDLKIDSQSMKDLQQVIREFNPTKINNPNALRRINETAVKLIMHSSNIEYAIDTLDQLGLRQKLVSMNLQGDGVNTEDASYWLQKEPLRSFKIPGSNTNLNNTKDPINDVKHSDSNGSIYKKLTDFFKLKEAPDKYSFADLNDDLSNLPKYKSGKLKTYSFRTTGRTAKDLGITIVAHETNNMLAYESITRSHSGEPNVLISRDKSKGEEAACGDGFYTAIGKFGVRDTGLTIRFTVDPHSREGVDFIKEGNYIIWLNKKSLKVIQESLNLGITEIIDLVVNKNSLNLDSSDRGILEKLKRRLNPAKILAELEKLMYSEKSEDQIKLEEVVTILLTNIKIRQLISTDVISNVIKGYYPKLTELKNSSNENNQIKYITQTSLIIEHLESSGLYSKKSFIEYLEKYVKDSEASYKVRKTALIELFTISTNLNKIDLLFSREELQQIRSEISDWKNFQNDYRKNRAGIVGTTYIDFIIFQQSKNKIGDLARMEFFLSLGPEIIRFNMTTRDKIREEILKISLTPEILTKVFNSIKGQTSSPDSNLQWIVLEILNANHEAVRLLTPEQLLDVVRCFGQDIVMRGIRDGDRLGLMAQGYSQNIAVPESLLVAYETKKSTEFVFALIGFKPPRYSQGEDNIIRFLDQAAQAPWITQADQLLLDLTLASARYIGKIEGVSHKSHGTFDYDKEIVRIYTEMAHQSPEWRKMIYNRFFLPSAKSKNYRNNGLIIFPYFLIEFVEFADLPVFLKVMGSLTGSNVSAFGNLYRDFKINKFSAKQVYEAFFNKPEYVEIQPAILRFFPEVYELLTVDSVKHYIANYDDQKGWLAKRLFKVYDGHIEHPVLAEAISHLNEEQKMTIKGLEIEKNITLELWFKFYLSYESKVTGSNMNGEEESPSRVRSAFLRINEDIFQTYLTKYKMTTQNFYEQIILKKMADDNLPNDEIKVIVWLLHNRKELGFTVDKQVTNLFWKQYNRAKDLRHLDHYTHPSYVGHGLPKE